MASDLVEYERDRVRANASRPLTHSLDYSKEGLMSQPIVAKACNVCGIVKPLEEFHKNARNRTTGRQAKCKPCEREYSRRWHAENRKDRAQRWAKSSQLNPHWLWENNYRKRMRRAGHVPVIVHFTREDLVGMYGDRCVYCGGPFEEIDHVVPIKHAGQHTIENVRPSCMPCNRAKYDKNDDAASAPERTHQ